MKFTFLDKENFRRLPSASGVYCFRRGREILYVGKAVNLKSRVQSHLREQNFRDRFFVPPSEKIGYLVLATESEALIQEARLIRQLQPKYNVAGKYGRNYFYVGFTKEVLPRVFITHQPLRKTRSTKPEIRNKFETKNSKHFSDFGSRISDLNYLGPFTDGRSLRNTLRLLRRIFPYYTAKKHPKETCWDCLLGLCPGPSADPRLYRRHLRGIKEVLAGKRKGLLERLGREMRRAVREENFEAAAAVRDQIFSLEKIFRQQPRSAGQILQEILAARKPIRRVEAFDVANLQGELPTGSLVVFVDEKPAKDCYRRFHIRLGEKPNDVAMIQELVERRLSHPEWPFPDLILIDGGKAQLNAALRARSRLAPGERIKMAALAKRNNELFVEGQKEPLRLKNLPRPVFNLILQLRDEAHRFARAYHFYLRKKRIFS